jgi:hypothetical protein
MVNQLLYDTHCSYTTALRHIKAALGLIKPIGERKARTNKPVRCITFRADDAEYEAVKGPARAAVNKLLAEYRAQNKEDNS